MRIPLHIWLCLAALAAPGLAAQEVYRSVDENGVVTFTDVATDDAERVELPPVVVREDAQAQQQSIIDQQLAVAKALEESRLAREAARTERLEALAAAQPDTVYYPAPDQTRILDGSYGWSGYFPGYRPHPRPPWRPDWPVRPHPPLRPEPPVPESPPSRRVPLPPLKSH